MSEIAVAQGARVPRPVFVAILWTGTSVSLSFVIFRLWVRIRAFKKLLVDDYFVIAAWLMLLGTSILWMVEVPILYDQYAIASGKKAIYPDFFSKDQTFLRTIVAFTYLFYSTLWSVKLSFLFFFQRIGHEFTPHRIWWWTVTGIVLVTYIGCIADIEYKCLLGDYMYIQTVCTAKPAIHWVNRTFYANCATDIISDCCILSIPIVMLWNIRIPLMKKVILFSLFSATVIVMAISIIRVTIVHVADTNVDISWLYLWSNIEVSTAICIACVASFRQLFVHTQTESEKKKQRSMPNYPSNKDLFSYLPSSETSNHSTSYRTSSSDTNDKTAVIPMDAIYVRNNVDVMRFSNDDQETIPYRVRFHNHV